MARKTTEPEKFLELLFGTKREADHILIWTLPDKISTWSPTTSAAVAAVQKAGDRDVYVGMGLSANELSSSSRAQNDEIAAIAGVWIDLDVQAEAHAQKSLPPTIDDALSILPKDFPPTAVVSTGNGLHVYWLFKEVWSFDGHVERDRAALLVQRWQALIRAAAASRGWTLDHTHDLARVLRVPGTMNRKDPAAPKLVALLSCEPGRRYEPSTLEEALDESGIPREFKRAKRVAGADFLVGLDRAVEPTILERLLEADPRFRATWARQRWDIHGQGEMQSEYDLAIANFGLDCGLPEQLIVDLMIEHRRKYGIAAKPRLDYYRRTLDRAYLKGAGHSRIKIDGLSEPETPAPAPARTDVERSLAMEEISAELGVRVLRILKITGKEPRYVLELEAGKIELPNIKKLLSLAGIRDAIAAQADILIPRIKAGAWDDLTRKILASLTTVEGGEDLTFEGEIASYVDDYLQSTQWIADVSDPKLGLSTKRRPMIIDGRAAVMAREVADHVRRNWTAQVTTHQVAAGLIALGAESYRLREKRLEQSRWLLPARRFAVDSYDNAVRAKTVAEESIHAV